MALVKCRDLQYFYIILLDKKMFTIKLKSGKEKLPKNFNPWIFSGAIESASGNPAKGDIVTVSDYKNNFIAYGHYNNSSKIGIRLLEWNIENIIDFNWYEKKITDAINRRIALNPTETDSCRLVFSEGDFLPGLIIDKYNNYLILQISTCGMEAVKDDIVKILLKLFPDVNGIFERSDSDGRKQEGLTPVTGIIAGSLPSDDISIIENNYNFMVNLTGQKTGFYTDQRTNRKVTSQYSEGKRILDVCCYSGAFAINCIKKGAKHVTLCDISNESLLQAKKNMEINGIPESMYDFINCNAFETLRNLQQQKEKYDMIILDPPKLVPSIHDLSKGLRAYKDLNLQALQLLNKGGYLSTFSCSGNVTKENFREAVTYAIKDAKCEGVILEQLSQANDHPIRISLPETEYLKGLLIQKN